VSVFNHYARYYDLLYRDKNYAGEARFVHEQLAKQGVAAGRLLELGCGTGRHAVEFAKLGWSEDGVDLSQAVAAQARERARQHPPEIASRLQFQQGDVRLVDTSRVYDAVISLYRVMSYQTSNEDLGPLRVPSFLAASSFLVSGTHLPFFLLLRSA
jgi:cyclopropane fatty-acyl-phospholipid synthase-like methyltransferase